MAKHLLTGTRKYVSMSLMVQSTFNDWHIEFQ